MKKTTGMTLTELMITLAILAIITMSISSLVVKVTEGIFKNMNRNQAMDDIRTSYSKYIESDLLEANQFLKATPVFIEFITDSSCCPGYNRSNLTKPDIDYDAFMAFSAAPDQRWKYGYNMEDDDDDNDGKVDYRIKIYFNSSTRQLFKETSINEGTWQKKVIASNIVYSSFTCYASRNNLALADTNNDGKVTDIEIDKAKGNKNGILDIFNETRYIISIYIEIAIDRNNDKKIDYTLRTEISPPMLGVKNNIVNMDSFK
jgi:prepilin-type N-terminal cleavage/methylation domain-containing protein